MRLRSAALRALSHSRIVIQAKQTSSMESTILLALLLLASCQHVEQHFKSVNKSNATCDPSVNRNKRETIVSNYSCPEGMSWLSYHCVDNDQYNKSKEDDYVEMTELQVENTSSEPSTTTQIPTSPYSGPTQTPRTLHTQPSSKYGPKKLRKKSWPRPKSPETATTTWLTTSSSGLETTPGLSLTSTGHSATLKSAVPSTTSGLVLAPVSRAKTISLPTTTVLFALCLSVFNTHYCCLFHKV